MAPPALTHNGGFPPTRARSLLREYHLDVLSSMLRLGPSVWEGTVAELYPEILKRDTKEDDQHSCSAAEALTRQEPFINQNLAYQALGMLTQLLRHGSVSYQGGFCNLASGRLAPLPIRWVTAHPSPTVTTVQFTSAKFHR